MLSDTRRQTNDTIPVSWQPSHVLGQRCCPPMCVFVRGAAPLPRAERSSQTDAKVKGGNMLDGREAREQSGNWYAWVSPTRGEAIGGGPDPHTV